ncbi:hypothetical protein EYF80_013655 [Liparis tanakae]|uniref:Uncharacterized protein n=1 Tax=Liparis tanakae TaxID=230148 RepID=A0A4Z2IF93_9TELE|nr:hypothetical protein EYF80_013655 [Liparis tanakae]
MLFSSDTFPVQRTGTSQGLAVVRGLHPAVTQQPLSFFWAFRCLLRVHPSGAPRYPGQQGAVQSIVERCTHQQHHEAQHLQALKLLPAQRQAHRPDDQRAQAVQHHAGGGADLFSDADPGEVKEGDADCVSQQSQQDERVVPDLTEGVQRVLQDLPRVAAEFPNMDEIHRDEKQRQDEEPKETWKWRTELNMTYNRKVCEAHDHQAQDGGEDADPLTRCQAAPQERHREQPSEDDDRSTQHLEAGGTAFPPLQPEGVEEEEAWSAEQWMCPPAWPLCARRALCSASLFSSSAFMVMNRSTAKLRKAPITARPVRM